jgi:hypothetical protein
VVNRLHQGILILAVGLSSWLGMQLVHESGHVLAAWLTGGRVVKVVFHPLTISRTDVAPSPHPLLVVWAGPVVGVVVPVGAWLGVRALRLPGAYLGRFFAGFCLIANGAYIGAGSFDRVGDCGEMLRHGSPLWALWLFGVAAVAAGLGMWHRLGPHFGLGKARGRVSPWAAYGSLAVLAVLLAVGFTFGGE